MCHVCLYYAVLFVPYSLVITCSGKDDLLALVFAVFFCVFVTFPYDIIGQVYLIVSLP